MIVSCHVRIDLKLMYNLACHTCLVRIDVEFSIELKGFRYHLERANQRRSEVL